MDASAGQSKPLGCTYDGRGASFSIFSSVAEKVEICFFDESGAERRHELSKDAGHIWHGYFDSIGPGRLYGYRVHGPWNPASGHLCCSEKLLLDPYAKAVGGEVRWHDSLFPYDPKNPATPAGREDTAPYVPKSVVVDSSFDWKGDSRPGTKLGDTIIYETHVKGFTVGHPGIPPELRGTYAGLAHPAAIEHLTGLGVTAVELLPVLQFIHRRRLVAQGLRNYWGYDPVCFFAPHGSYAFDRSLGGAVKEFKGMVKSLHSAGLEVILDVVFNHTCEGGVDGAVLCFKGIDNSAYYQISPGDELRYADYTGTQNALNAEHPQVRRLIIDALLYWTDEMHVDGFRFDLAPVLAREKGHIRLEGAVLEAIRAELSPKGVKLIAEPWDIGENGYQGGRFPAGWSEWNDRYQDDVRDYWNGRDGAAGRLMLRFAGSPDVYRAAGKSPQASVNYVTCHDGFTLHDLVSYGVKRNEANREGGRDGRDDNHAWNCGVEGPTDDPGVSAVRARQKRNFMATLLLSQGVPMLLGGDELGRTQRGNNNAYCQDNETSWLDWSAPDGGMREFVKKLISLRRARRGLRRSDWPSGEEGALQPAFMAWYDPAGNEIRGGDASDSPREPLQVVFSGEGGTSPCKGGRTQGGDPGSSEGAKTAGGYEAFSGGPDGAGGRDLLIMFNPRGEDIAFELPAQCKSGLWSVAVDTAVGSVSPEESASPAQGPVKLVPHSLVVLSREE